jgi:hypothetical protein
MREGIDGVIEIGGRGNFSEVLPRLSDIQAFNVQTADALATFENALNENSQDIVYRPDVLNRRGEFRPKQGQ